MKTKSQAVLEMALFGGLIIAVFSSVLYYIQAINGRQLTTMKVFRRALRKANHENAVVQYSLLDVKRNMDINAPFRGSRTQDSASASVYWAVPKVGKMANTGSFYGVNSYEFEYDPGNFTIGTVDTDSRESFNDTFVKNEGRSKIVTSREIGLGDDINIIFRDEDGNILKRVKETLVSKKEGGYVITQYKPVEIEEEGGNIAFSTGSPGMYKSITEDIGGNITSQAEDIPYTRGVKRRREWDTSF